MGRIESVQPFSDLIGPNPHRGIGTRVVGDIAAKQVHANTAFFQRVDSAIERNLHDITQKLGAFLLVLKLGLARIAASSSCTVVCRIAASTKL